MKQVFSERYMYREAKKIRNGDFAMIFDAPHLLLSGVSF